MPTPVFPISGIIDNTPDPYQKQHRFRIERNNTKGAIELKTSRDGGLTYKVLMPEVTSKVRVGSIPTVQSDGNVSWASPAVQTSNNVLYAELQSPTTLSVNDQFGFYCAPSIASKCIGIQFAINTPAIGSAIHVVMVTRSGVETGKTHVIDAGAYFSLGTYEIPVEMTAGSQWRLKIKQVGSTIPGEFLFARLVIIPS